MNPSQELLQSVVAIAVQAGHEILSVYHRDRQIEVIHKEDESPLTEADTRANRVIVASLCELTRDIPIIAEESEAAPYKVRRQWRRFWLVDPLDGTKEFISRNDEFTVNIALIVDGEPVLGVVHVPAKGITYSGMTGDEVAGSGAWRRHTGGTIEPLQSRSMPDHSASHKGVRVVASRRHGAEALELLLDKLTAQFSSMEQINIGSSLKICMLAEGEADLYPRLAPTSQWDIAAAHAVLRAAGGEIYTTDFEPLSYRQAETLLNPHFIAVADTAYPWKQILSEDTLGGARGGVSGTKLGDVDE